MCTAAESVMGVQQRAAVVMSSELFTCTSVPCVPGALGAIGGKETVVGAGEALTSGELNRPTPEG